MLLLGAGLSGATGCGGDRLDGSISEAFDLSFNAVELRRSSSAFQVSYLKSEGREVVMRLTVATAGIDLGEGADIDLSGEYAPGHPRATVTRAVDGQPLLALPRVARGRLELDDAAEVGAEISGSFSLSFADGGDVGAGRTLEGDFHGRVRAAD